jgi:prevent-host-death family protein
MEKISSEEARRNFSKLMGHVAFGGGVTIITKNGSDHVVMISIDAFRRYQEMEDYLDGLEATEAIREMKKRGGRTLEEILEKVEREGEKIKRNRGRRNSKIA